MITHLPDHDERRSILSHKEFPPDGYYEQYKMRIHILSIDDDGDDDEGASYRSGGGSAQRNRKRKMPRARQSYPTNPNRHATKTEERWMDGVDLKPQELVSYWSRFNRAIASNGTPQPVWIRTDAKQNFTVQKRGNERIII